MFYSRLLYEYHRSEQITMVKDDLKSLIKAVLNRENFKIHDFYSFLITIEDESASACVRFLEKKYKDMSAYQVEIKRCI